MKLIYYSALFCSFIALVLYLILRLKWLFAIAILLVVLSGAIRRKNSKSID